MAEKVVAIKIDVQGTADQNKKLAGLEKTIKGLTDERKRLNKAVKEGSITQDEFATRIARVNTNLKGARAELNKTRNSVLGLQSFTQKLGGSFKRLGQTISGAFVGLFAAQKVLELATAAGELVTKLDEVTASVQRLGDVSEEEAKKVSANILAIGSAFDQSADEILVAANAVSTQFGIPIEEAVDKIQLSFAAGSNASGELLDILKEYPALLSEVGLSADESFALINQQVTQGIYSDKGVDAIKEAGLRLRELPQATRDALDGIGLSSVEIEKALTEGTKSVFDVVQEVSGALGELPPQSAAVGTAIADIFGGPGEDAGLAFLTTLDDINLSFEDTVGNLDEYGQAQNELVDAQTEFNEITQDLFDGASVGFTNLKAGAISLVNDGLRFIIDGVSGLITGFKELFNDSQAFRNVIFGIKNAFEVLFSVVLTPFKLLGNTLQTLVESLSFLIDGEFSKAAGAFADGFERAGQIIKDTAKDVNETITSNVKDAVETRLEIQEEGVEKEKVIAQKSVAVVDRAEQAKKAAAIKAQKELAREREKQAKKEERDAEKIRKAEERVEARRLAQEQKFLDKVANLKQKAELNSIKDEQKFALEKLSLEEKALQEEAALKIDNEVQLQTALADIRSSFAVKEDQIKADAQAKEKERKEQNALDIATFTVDSTRGLVNSIADLELAEQQRRLERGLITEEQFAQEKFKIEKKAFERQKKIDTAQALINGYVAITKAWAQGGIFGAISAGIVAAQTGLQVAAINKQTFPASFAEGGYTGDGYGSADATGFKQAGVVHEGEYVIPKKVLETPRGSQMASALEAMRTSRPMPSMGLGFANGGFTSAPAGLDMEGLRQEIVEGVAATIQAIPVVNNATDTVTQASRVVNIQAQATFG